MAHISTWKRIDYTLCFTDTLFESKHSTKPAIHMTKVLEDGNTYQLV